MSRADDSDEEVFLGDPSDSDETGSIEDYQYSDDSQALADFEEGTKGAIQNEIDYALHDAEVERASGIGPKAPAVPQPPGAVKSASVLSPEAKPWVPSTSGAHGLASHNHGNPAPVTSANDEGRKTQAEAIKPIELKTAQSSTQVKPQEGESKSPIDVGKILQRLADEESAEAGASKAATESLNPSIPAKNSITASLSGNLNGAKDVSSTLSGQSQSPKAAPKDSTEEAGEVPTKDTSDKQDNAGKRATPASSSPTVEDESSQPQGETQTPATDKSKAEDASASDKTEKPSAGNLETSTQETQQLASELPGTAAASAPNQTADSGPQSSSQEDAKKVKPESGGQAEPSNRSADNASSQAPSKPSGMPSLPQRNRSSPGPPKGMPMLPARPARKATSPAPPQSQPDSAKAAESSSSQPPQGSAPPQPQGQTSSNGQGSEGGEAQPQPVPANGHGERQRALVGSNPPEAAPRPSQEQPPESEQVKKTREKLRQLRIQLFRLASRLGYSDHNLVRTIKYRLDSAERVRLDRSAPPEDLVSVAKELEEENPDEDIYTITVMVIGISGAGKSATINSLLGREAVSADAFEGTSNVTEVTNTEFGLKLRFIDTPGLEAAAESSSYNAKILKKIDKARKKYKPDLVIYCERMDVLRRDLSDVPILRQITEVLGSEVWFNTLIIITHATAAGPLNRNGQSLTFDQLSQTRAAMFQRALQGSVGDHRINAPTAFAENSPSCPRNANGELILPNNLTWRKFVLMYLASIKVLREADSLLQVQAPKQQSAMNQLTMLLQAQRGMKLPPLPFLITNMIKHAGPKQYPEVERDILREDEIQAIQKFGLRRREWRKRTGYLKENHARRRASALPDLEPPPEADPYEPPGPGPALSPTFDSDENSFYYRSYEPKPGEGGWITRPRMEQNVIDHTDGVDSLTTERSFVKRKKDQELDGIPASVHCIIQKDKVNQLFQGGAEASLYQTWRIVHTGRAQVMTLSGGDVLYISQLESQLKYVPRNKLTLGGMVSRLSEEGTFLPIKGKVALGLKLEDDVDLPDFSKYNIKNNLKAGIGRATINLGSGRKEEAIGMNAEYQLIGGKRENYQAMASFSQMKYRGNKGRQYALSGSVPVTEETTITPKLQLQSGNQGQISVRVASYDHSAIGLVVFLPLGKALLDKLRNKNAPEEA